jgi:hypothetical protein
VFNEFSIVTSEAQEASDLLTVVRLRPIHYCTSLTLLGVDAVLVNVKAAKINILTSPGAYCTFGLETMFCQQGKHSSDMNNVFGQGTAVNHIIVNV